VICGSSTPDCRKEYDKAQKDADYGHLNADRVSDFCSFISFNLPLSMPFPRQMPSSRLPLLWKCCLDPSKAFHQYQQHGYQTSLPNPHNRTSHYEKRYDYPRWLVPKKKVNKLGVFLVTNKQKKKKKGNSPRSFSFLHLKRTCKS
jgi:hypothetical protein